MEEEEETCWAKGYYPFLTKGKEIINQQKAEEKGAWVALSVK